MKYKFIFKIFNITMDQIFSDRYGCNICAICREELKVVCIKCRANYQKECQSIMDQCGDAYYERCNELWLTNQKECRSVMGQCGHAYHQHCIELWLTNRIVCPLDNRIVCPLDNRKWRLHNENTGPKSLKQLCYKKIAMDINLTLQGIIEGETVVTAVDWEEIRKYAEKPSRLYTFKKPENIPKAELRVLEIQFKTPHSIPTQCDVKQK